MASCCFFLSLFDLAMSSHVVKPGWKSGQLDIECLTGRSINDVTLAILLTKLVGFMVLSVPIHWPVLCIVDMSEHPICMEFMSGWRVWHLSLIWISTGSGVKGHTTGWLSPVSRGQWHRQVLSRRADVTGMLMLFPFTKQNMCFKEAYIAHCSCAKN